MSRRTKRREGEGKGDPAPTSGNEPSASSTTGNATDRRHRVFNEFQGGDVTEHEFDPEKQMDDPASTLPNDTEGDGKSGDGNADPAGALEEGTEGPVGGEPAPSAGNPTNRRRVYRNEGEVAPAPAEPEVTPPVSPVNPDGSPIEEEPLVPPQPALTNEAGVEEPEGLPGGEGEPKPVEEPAPGVDPNGDPEVPNAVTEPHREVVETPPETIPNESAEKELNQDRLFRWL